MDGGATRKRRATPPIENPMSCVDMTSSHPSSKWLLGDLLPCTHGTRTDKVKVLVVIYSLDSHNVRLQDKFVS